MSMTINNGFRISGLDMLLLHRRVTAFRSVVSAMAAEAYATLLSRMACKLIDHAYADGKPWTPSPAWHVRNIVNDERRKLASSSYRNPTYDFGFTIYFVPDGRSKCIHGVVACERRDWVDAWMALPFVETYEYWDGTDRSESVPAAEWRRRRSAWTRLIPRTSLRDDWMTVEMTNEHMFADVDRLVALQPSEEERRRMIADNRVMAEDIDPHIGDISMSVLMKAMAVLGTPEGQARVQDVASRIWIPSRIDEDMMTADTMPRIDENTGSRT